MHILDITAILTTLAALLSYVNHRFVGKLGLAGIERTAETFIRSIDFNKTLMQGMLSFLLFAGALHVNLGDLAEQKWVVGTLATVGTVASTFVVGGLFWLLVNGLGLNVPPIYCLLFGALISPTDPIAVLGILKTAGAPKSLETKITGESLFNDGIGVVVFVVLLELATGGHELSLPHIAVLFAEEAVGGILFGLVLGGIAYWMLSRIDNYSVEVLITLAVVMGGYALALAIHTSGPIAMVVAGLVIGNHGRRFAMSDKTRDHLDTFWELIDEILNTVLFVLIGFELLILEFSGKAAVAGLVAIPIVLLARLVCVGTPIRLMKLWRTFTPGAVKILTWGGLRGGISVALALSIPAGPERDLILPVTYTVVVFSILVQGLTIGRLVAAEASAAKAMSVTRDQAGK
jgi:CPA1 family monovalent cation:H+ antiporter